MSRDSSYLALGLALAINIISFRVIRAICYLPINRKVWRTQTLFLKASENETTNGKLTVEQQAIEAYATLTLSTITAALWYGFYYVLEQTFKPAWAEWFGQDFDLR